MRVFGILLALCVFMLCVLSESFGNGAVKTGKGADKALTGGPAAGPTAPPVGSFRLGSARASCRIVTKGQKPLSAVLEDCVAYALDIPLAMMTPFVTAITPVMDKLDCGCDNYRPRARK